MNNSLKGKVKDKEHGGPPSKGGATLLIGLVVVEFEADSSTELSLFHGDKVQNE